MRRCLSCLTYGCYDPASASFPFEVPRVALWLLLYLLLLSITSQLFIIYRDLYLYLFTTKFTYYTYRSC